MIKKYCIGVRCFDVIPTYLILMSTSTTNMFMAKEKIIHSQPVLNMVSKASKYVLDLVIKKSFLIAQIRDRRNILSYGESLKSDLFQMFDDLEGI